VNRAFAKYLHAITTEQALALTLGNILSANQGAQLNMNDVTAATPKDNSTFDEAVSHSIPLKLVFACMKPFPLISFIWSSR
jgi:hypothetical protein